MNLVHSAEELRALLATHRAAGEMIGFVPTMGALHEGHASLLRQSKRENPVTVLSVFVNPTQFGPNEDFSRYPRTLESDCEIARREGVSYVFAPDANEMYPEGFSTFVEVEGVTAPLCGSFRPGHFRGVTTVVYRLFALVQPTAAYFGQKDLQQCLVVQRMVKDLLLPVRVEIVPTVRESDGLALSSRNRYLSAEEREKALVIFRALQEVKTAVAGGERSVKALLDKALAEFAKTPEFQVQYCEIRSFPDLKEVSRLDGPAAMAVAGFMGKTRLIDNILLNEAAPSP
jgi:pantoate--beta-alanine ligase